MENYLPGKLSAMGLGYDQLSVDNPGLVYCSITGRLILITFSCTPTLENYLMEMYRKRHECVILMTFAKLKIDIEICLTNKAPQLIKEILKCVCVIEMLVCNLFRF